MTTARVTHASPAGVYAHIPNRNWEAVVQAPDCDDVDDIAYQLVHDKGNQNIKVELNELNLLQITASSDTLIR